MGCIGPALFNIFNKNFEEGFQFKMSVYADDWQLCKVISTEKDALILQRVMDKLKA